MRTTQNRSLIFPASRPFTEAEEEKLKLLLHDFLQHWTAHGVPLSAKLNIEYHQFLIITIDESVEPASGCSIDALSSFIKDLDKKYELHFSQETKIYFLEKNEVKTLSLPEFRKKVKTGELKNISVFDFSKGIKDFLLPIEKSWANIYL